MSTYQPGGLKKIFHQTRRFLAKTWLSLFNPLQIGITGSQGKTNTTQLLAKILSRFGPTVVTDTNLDTVYNVSITALKVRPWTKYLVWELGIDQPKEMEKHLEIAKPKIGIITGISPVHTDADHLGSLENLIQEKRKLIENLPEKGTAILNYDDPHVRTMADFIKAKVKRSLTTLLSKHQPVRLFGARNPAPNARLNAIHTTDLGPGHSGAGVKYYGSDSNHCHVYFDPASITIDLNGTTFNLISKKTGRRFFVKTKLIGSHHPSNLAAIYLALETIFPKFNQSYHQHFVTIVTKLSPLRGRMSVEKGPMGTVVLNDSLRANPESTRRGLETLAKINYQKGRKIAVLGVMGELENPKLEHEKTGEQLIKYSPDLVICLGDWRKYTYQKAIDLGFPQDKIFFAKDVFASAEILKKILKKNDLIYLKGSFLRNLKRILQILNNQPVCCRADICPYEHCGYQKT